MPKSVTFVYVSLTGIFLVALSWKIRESAQTFPIASASAYMYTYLSHVPMLEYIRRIRFSFSFRKIEPTDFYDYDVLKNVCYGRGMIKTNRSLALKGYFAIFIICIRLSNGFKIVPSTKCVQSNFQFFLVPFIDIDII